MESDAFDDESSSGSSSSLTPGVNLAQRMHMENELRELRSQQKSMEAEMRQMRRDMHQMRQRVHDSPSMVQQQAGLMLKANATDVKREIGRTRDELRERTDNIFTKEEYDDHCQKSEALRGNMPEAGNTIHRCHGKENCLILLTHAFLCSHLWW